MKAEKGDSEQSSGGRYESMSRFEGLKKILQIRKIEVVKVL